MGKRFKVATLFIIGVLLGTVPMWSGGAFAESSGFVGINVEEIRLANGFRVLVVEDHRVPRIAASLWYRLGAIRELSGEHGSTHFLEHAVHQGTTTVGTRNFEAEKPILREIHETEQKLVEVWNRERNRLRERNVFYDELDWPTTPEMDSLRQRLYELEDQDSQYREFWAEYNWYRRYGAIAHADPVPATTWKEYLEIDIDLPKEAIELLFRLEADRMVNAVLRGWEAQRFTVLEQILNRHVRPETGRFSEAIDGVTGLAHPAYNSAAGHFRDFAYYNRASMLGVYDDYFVPSNATLALVGDIAPGEARTLAERYFGQLARGAESPALMDVEAEPVPGGAVRLDWLEPMDPRVILRYRVPGVGHPERPVFDTIAALTRGRHGLFAASLAGKAGAPANVDFQAVPTRLGSANVIDFIAKARRDEDLPGLEETMLAVLDDLQKKRIDAKALERARKTLRLEWDRTRSERRGLAKALGQFQVMDSWETLQTFMEARLSASVEDIQRAARRYFVPSNRVIVIARERPLSHERPGSRATTSMAPMEGNEP